jgi:hypothetical protein
MAKKQTKSTDFSLGSDDLRPVTVKNNGTRPWSGTDYAHVGDGYIPGGGEAIVTARKAADLLAMFADGQFGVGPFEVIGDAGQ